MTGYYWCFTHGTVERGEGCRADDRLGPYATDADARSWRERRDTREESWEAEDKRWHGEEDEDEG